MQYRFVLMLGLLLMLCFTQVNAQNSSVATYAGAYYSSAHPAAGLSIHATADGGAFQMDFCKNLILNDCKQVTLQKALGSAQEFQVATSDHGGSAAGFSATVSAVGDHPVIQVKLVSGEVWEFVRR